MTVSWDELVRVGDPGLGQQVTLMAPALTISFYLQEVDYDGVAQLYAEAMKLIEPGLTHYQAESMKRPAKISPRALGMIPTWMRKPKEFHSYWWEAHGGADLGQSPPGLELLLLASAIGSPEQKKQAIENALEGANQREINGHAIRSAIRILLPVDHELGRAEALARWLTSLDLLKRGTFGSIEACFGLAASTSVDRETARREQAACSRYPGLDAFRYSHSGQVRVDRDYPDMIPLVRRPAWTNVLHELTLRALGGEATIRTQLADAPEVRVTAFEHGVIVQAGDRPELGDLNRGDLLPVLRQVAQVLGPVRARKLVEAEAERHPFWEQFFNTFEKSYQ
ncbi:MAG: type VI immunity family protein [Myxococcales bacterium]